MNTRASPSSISAYSLTGPPSEANLAALVSASLAAPTRAFGPLVERRVAHDDRLDRGAVRILDLGRGRPQRIGEPLVRPARPVVRQPLAKLPLLPASKPRDLLWVVGPLLDQGERLEDGVMEMRSHLRALVRASACDALRADSPHHREPERSGDQHQCDRHDECRQRHLARGLERAVRPEEEQCGAEEDSHPESDLRDPTCFAAQCRRGQVLLIRPGSAVAIYADQRRS